jgi:hypothetical protein
MHVKRLFYKIPDATTEEESINLGKGLDKCRRAPPMRRIPFALTRRCDPLTYFSRKLSKALIRGESLMNLNKSRQGR